MATEAPLQLGQCRVDPTTGEVWVGEDKRRLEPRVLQVLMALADDRDNPVARSDLLRTVWGDVAVSDDALQRCVSILRRTLGRGENGVRIETIPKVGYRLLVEALDPPSAQTMGVRTPGEAPPVQDAMPDKARQTAALAPLVHSPEASTVASGRPSLVHSPEASTVASGRPSLVHSPEASTVASGHPSLVHSSEASTVASAHPSLVHSPEASTVASGHPSLVHSPEASTVASAHPSLVRSPAASTGDRRSAASAALLGHRSPWPWVAVFAGLVLIVGAMWPQASTPPPPTVTP